MRAILNNRRNFDIQFLLIADNGDLVVRSTAVPGADMPLYFDPKAHLVYWSGMVAWSRSKVEVKPVLGG